MRRRSKFLAALACAVGYAGALFLALTWRP